MRQNAQSTQEPQRITGKKEKEKKYFSRQQRKQEKREEKKNELDKIYMTINIVHYFADSRQDG